MVEGTLISDQASPQTHDDEIDLVDIARVLLRRKWWIIGTFLVVTLGALAYGLQQQRVYAYTTSIELGEFGPEEFVAGAASTASTISDRILLSTKRAFLQERDLESMPFDVSVNTPEESSFVNLVSEAPLEDQSLVAEFHERVFERLRDEHQSRLSIMENQSDAKLENLRSALETQKDRLSMLEELSVIRNKGSGDEGNVRAEARSGEEDMQAELASTDAALTMLLSQLQLSERISEREQAMNELQGEIREEETKRSWIKPTRAEDVAVASLSPVGTSRALIAVLGAILGGMLGLFMAFMVEFAAKVRESE